MEAFSMDAKFVVFSASVTTYLIYKQFEPGSLLATFVLLLLFPSLVTAVVRDQFSSIFVAAPYVFCSYWFSIASLAVTYRLSPLHPLASFPGPLLCKISKLWLAYKVSHGKSHVYHLELHAKYGDVVRIGPNELSFKTEEAINPVQRDSLKGPYYTIRQNGSLIGLDGRWEDMNAYSQRRKPWNRGLSTAAFKDYEDALRNVLRDLMVALEKRQGESVNLATWLLYASFDFTGEISFGKHFNCVKNGSDTSGLIHALQKGLEQASLLAHIPWMWPMIFVLIKFLDNKGSWRTLQSGGAQMARDRLTQGSTKRDLFHYLSNEDLGETEKLPLDVVAVDGALVIVAGSDTSATALNQTFYFLLRHPVYMERLRKEVESVYPGTTDPLVDFGKQAEMPFLNACINEALRLYPPVLSGLQRQLTSGQMVGSYYLPKGTIASVNPCALQRDPRNFSPLPDTFWPDRWLTQETYTLPSGKILPKDKLIHNRNAFIPFSLGIRNCPGKNVAWLEMRAILCALVQKFDITKAPEYNLDDWEKNLRDVFVTAYGPLLVNLKARY